MGKDKVSIPPTFREAPDKELIEELRRRGLHHAFTKKRSYKKHSFEVEWVPLAEFYVILLAKKMLVKEAATEAVEDWVRKYRKPGEDNSVAIEDWIRKKRKDGT